MKTISRRECLFFGTVGPFFVSSPLKGAQEKNLPRDDGYRGIWYSNQPTKDKYGFKYSGGFATYPQQHIPIAYYSREANKTFFCYGGVAQGKNELLHMVSYFDHSTGLVPRPVILLNKKTTDAHDNPTIMLDDAGHIWIFSNAHGTSRPAYIHRSHKPLNIESFERILTTNFSYSQPWYIPKEGFLFLHTRYSPGRNLFWMTSRDGRKWNEPQPLSRIEMGHYQISWPFGNRLGTAFNYHPKPVGLNARTNLYFLQTDDMGKTWRTAEGKPVDTPLTSVRNAALVHDYQAEKKLVYLKDLQWDQKGQPILLYLTSRGWEPGPNHGPRQWHTAHWTGSAWNIRPFTISDHNYDFGSLYVENEGTWRIIAPTEPGPQAYTTGGEITMWTSRDEGKTWNKIRQLTRNSKRNHTYCRRPVHAHPDFYSFWADGDTLRQSPSNLYFTNRQGTGVWRLPERMDKDFARPELAWG
jgi:hypothetical protein